jgi:hypothetical protein
MQRGLGTTIHLLLAYTSQVHLRLKAGGHSRAWLRLAPCVAHVLAVGLLRDDAALGGGSVFSWGFQLYTGPGVLLSRLVPLLPSSISQLLWAVQSQVRRCIHSLFPLAGAVEYHAAGRIRRRLLPLLRGVPGHVRVFVSWIQLSRQVLALVILRSLVAPLKCILPLLGVERHARLVE